MTTSFDTDDSPFITGPSDWYCCIFQMSTGEFDFAKQAVQDRIDMLEQCKPVDPEIDAQTAAAVETGKRILKMMSNP